MKKALKWFGMAFVVLIIIGLIFGEPENAAQNSGPKETQSEVGDKLSEDESKRKEIWLELSNYSNVAYQESEKKYPESKAPIEPEALNQYYLDKAQYVDQLELNNFTEILEREGLTEEELDAIIFEGADKGWGLVE